MWLGDLSGLKCLLNQQHAANLDLLTVRCIFIRSIRCQSHVENAFLIHEFRSSGGLSDQRIDVIGSDDGFSAQ